MNGFLVKRILTSGDFPEILCSFLRIRFLKNKIFHINGLIANPSNLGGPDSEIWPRSLVPNHISVPGFRRFIVDS